jgi:hypothetical protein
MSYADLAATCRDKVHALVPDVVFECWEVQNAEKCEEALVLWSFISADLGNFAEETSEIEEILVAMKRRCQTSDEIDLTFCPPADYRPMLERAKKNEIWWHSIGSLISCVYDSKCKLIKGETNRASIETGADPTRHQEPE